MEKKYVFVCGCPRSGTSALCGLLNIHPDVCIGMERYFKRILEDGELTPEMFTLPRFIDYRSSDSFWPDLPERDFLIKRYESSLYVGEKLPRLYERFELLRDNFPVGATKVIFIFRGILGVAESYTRRAKNTQDKNWGRQQDWRVAIQDWNRAIAAYMSFKGDLDILPVSYEQLFCSQQGEGEEVVKKIEDFLGIPPYPELEMGEVRTRFFGRVEVHGKDGLHTPEEVKEIVEKADITTFQLLFK